MNINKFKTLLSQYTEAAIPYLFVLDFELEKPFLCTLEKALDEDILYDFNGRTNTDKCEDSTDINLESDPILISLFKEKCENVINHICNGDTYLLNLTFPTKITVNKSIKDIFSIAKAKYKLYFKDQFVLFSPECFIKIEGNSITTYPMKGTIDATLKNAEKLLLTNKKEEWEHNTIVDLMRNDLALISSNIEVAKFRYIDKISTHKGELLQTSSEVKGYLPPDWKKDFGDRLLKLLPAGSISGAPKKRTVEIIKEQELDNRGYYTGVVGIFDGKNVECAVAIRYIEKKNNQLYYRSGGGITSKSKSDEEYNELLQKIYVPTF